MTNQTPSFADRLGVCYTGAVYDVLRSKGFATQTLPKDIRPLNASQKLAGPVFTIEGRRDDSLDAHQSLLRWCELLSKAPSETVLVCQPNDNSLAFMGELSSETLRYKRVFGYIFDGGCRDSAFIEASGFPVFCKYFTPVDVVGRWATTALGQPIEIGGVTISTGDYVLADRDGVVVIPGAIAEQVIQETEEVLRKENLVRKAILEGVDPVDAYLKHRKFLMKTEEKSAKLLRIHRDDNVLVVVRPIRPGDRDLLDGREVLFSQDIGIGHKVASREIKAGEKLYKCGVPIGSAKEVIPAGGHIHLHNLKSDYIATYTLDKDHVFVK